jgi:exodeoxyribonuclease VII small subunit
MSSKTAKPIGYAEAIAELEDILGEIEDSDVDLDRLAGRVERASVLVKTLKTRIRETELKVNRVVQNLREEVERVEEHGTAPAPPAGDSPPADEPMVDCDGAPLVDDGPGALFDDSAAPDEDVPF